MTTLLLARHGETDWNRAHRWQGHADRPLTDRGRAQAGALAERLADIALDAVYSSDLRRARETAQAVARAHGLDVVELPELREVNVGSWQGLTRDEAETRFPHGFRRWFAGGTGWEDGETYAEMSARVLAAVVRIATDHRGGRVLIVSHGGPIRAIHGAAIVEAHEVPFGRRHAQHHEKADDADHQERQAPPHAQSEVAPVPAHAHSTTLRRGDRVYDAIAAAGGLTEDADPTRLPDLAGRLKDGEQIKVPFLKSTPGSVVITRTNLNTATLDELEVVPGFTQALAEEVIDYRTNFGGFQNTRELVEILGMSEADFVIARRYLSL